MKRLHTANPNGGNPRSSSLSSKQPTNPNISREAIQKLDDLSHKDGSTTASEISTDYDLLKSSIFFDSNWYLDTYKDVASTGGDPIEHYLRYGAKEGRNPGPRFNTKKYSSAQSNNIKHGMNPLVHYILNGGAPKDLVDLGMLKAFSQKSVYTGMVRLQNFPLFSIADYTELNSDIDNPNVDRLNHAMAYGFSEGRQVFRKDVVARILGSVSRDLPTQAPPWGRRKVPQLPKIGVLYNSEGNEFIRELASDLVDLLRSVGKDASLLNERVDMRSRPDLCIFTAPHEFFHLGQGKLWAVEDVIKGAVMYNTEQPQTLWFERAMPFILLSKGVIDICHQIPRIFEIGQIPAIHLQPYIDTATTNSLAKHDQEHQLFKVLPMNAKLPGRRDSAIADRSIDISFFGTSSNHRETFFLRNAAYLSNYECYLYYRKFSGPITNSARDGILSRLPQHVAMHSKISLNIHRDDFGFFEWHRIVKLGLACGSTVVSEPCLPHPYYKPNIHFFEETGRHIPNLIEWLLKSHDGARRAEEARIAAFAMMNNKESSRNSSLELVSFLARIHYGVA